MQAAKIDCSDPDGPRPELTNQRFNELFRQVPTTGDATENHKKRALYDFKERQPWALKAGFELKIEEKTATDAEQSQI